MWNIIKNNLLKSITAEHAFLPPFERAMKTHESAEVQRKGGCAQLTIMQKYYDKAINR